MPRRALRKIDPALDLSRHLWTWERLPQPWDAALLFGDARPLEVEVGSGKGLFLQNAAAENPSHHFLGVEVATKYARFAAARLARLGLPNAALLHGDAQRLFSELLGENSLAAVHIYFPDPWWKKRHHKRRVMNPTFVRHVERALAPGAILHYRTDVQERFSEALELIGRETTLARRPEPEQIASPEPWRTHYERRTLLEGRPVYRAEFRKGGDLAPS